MSASGNGKVWICHYAGGKYNEQEVDDDGTYNGHLGHENDIIPRPAGGCPGDESSGPPTSPPPSSATPTVTVTATAVVPGPGTVSVVTSTQTATATATVTATPTITPSPGVVEQSPTITPSPGVVEQSPTIAPLPATVPAGGGGEAPGGLPIWALLALTAAVIAGIGASVRLSQRTSR